MKKILLVSFMFLLNFLFAGIIKAEEVCISGVEYVGKCVECNDPRLILLCPPCLKNCNLTIGSYFSSETSVQENKQEDNDIEETSSTTVQAIDILIEKTSNDEKTELETKIVEIQKKIIELLKLLIERLSNKTPLN